LIIEGNSLLQAVKAAMPPTRRNEKGYNKEGFLSHNVPQNSPILAAPAAEIGKKGSAKRKNYGITGWSRAKSLQNMHFIFNL
jgi:hypothetical protein